MRFAYRDRGLLSREEKISLYIHILSIRNVVKLIGKQVDLRRSSKIAAHRHVLK